MVYENALASFLFFMMAFYIAIYGLDLRGSYIEKNKIVGRGEHGET